MIAGSGSTFDGIITPEYFLDLIETAEDDERVKAVALDLEAIDTVEQAFAALASGQVVMPPMPLIGSPAVAGSRAISATMFSAIGFTAGPQ